MIHFTIKSYVLFPACAASFGMEAGSNSTYKPTILVSSGSIPADKAKINSPTAWCATTTDTNQYFEYDFGVLRTISGFAIQGHPVDMKWVTTFNVDYKQQQNQSYTTYQESGSNKVIYLVEMMTNSLHQIVDLLRSTRIHCIR